MNDMISSIEFAAYEIEMEEAQFSAWERHKERLQSIKNNTESVTGEKQSEYSKDIVNKNIEAFKKMNGGSGYVDVEKKGIVYSRYDGSIPPEEFMEECYEKGWLKRPAPQKMPKNNNNHKNNWLQKLANF